MCGNFQYGFRIFSAIPHFSANILILHTPYRMPITFIIQIVIAFGLKVIYGAAPRLYSAEIVGTPKSGLLSGMVIAGFGVIASGGSVKAGNRLRFCVIRIPKLRERFHHFPGDGMATQSLKEFLPFAVVGQVPAFGADSTNRFWQRFGAVMMAG